MSRSAVDATRFTATSPHAYSKPSALRASASNTFSPSSIPRSHTQPRNVPPTQLPPQGSGSPAETPAQKVARLRAQHAAQRQGQISTWDKIVVRGRVWADRAHRATAMGLISLTVIAGGVTLFALGDMIIYNRRKRNAFYAEQHLLLQQRLAEAREAAAKGIANEDQILLLNRERVADEAETARKARKGVLGYVKALFSTEGLKQEEADSGTKLLGEQSLRKVGEEAGGQMPSIAGAAALIETGGDLRSHQREMTTGSIVKAVEEKRREGEKELEQRKVEGGPLDQYAAQVAAAGKAKGGWTSWVTSK